MTMFRYTSYIKQIGDVFLLHNVVNDKVVCLVAIKTILKLLQFLVNFIFLYLHFVLQVNNHFLF